MENNKYITDYNSKGISTLNSNLVCNHWNKDSYIKKFTAIDSTSFTITFMSKKGKKCIFKVDISEEQSSYIIDKLNLLNFQTFVGMSTYYFTEQKINELSEETEGELINTKTKLKNLESELIMYKKSLENGK